MSSTGRGGWLAVLIFWLMMVGTGTADEQPSRIEPVIIASELGRTVFTAEIADTPELRQRGLMFRQRLPADSAMLFDFLEPRPVHMWMKNTYVALDMIFIRADGTIASIAENTVPMSEAVLGDDRAMMAVLEVAAGTAARLHIKPGDRVYNRIFGNLAQ